MNRIAVIYNLAVWIYEYILSNNFVEMYRVTVEPSESKKKKKKHEQERE